MPPAVVAALSDDLNTPGAIAALHGLSDPAELLAGAGLLGLLDASMGGWAAAPDAGDAATLIEKLIAARADARAAKDFARSDAIRDGLDRKSVV